MERVVRAPLHFFLDGCSSRRLHTSCSSHHLARWKYQSVFEYCAICIEDTLEYSRSFVALVSERSGQRPYRNCELRLSRRCRWHSDRALANSLTAMSLWRCSSNAGEALYCHRRRKVGPSTGRSKPQNSHLAVVPRNTSSKGLGSSLVAFSGLLRSRIMSPM